MWLPRLFFEDLNRSQRLGNMVFPVKFRVNHHDPPVAPDHVAGAVRHLADCADQWHRHVIRLDCRVCSDGDREDVAARLGREALERRQIVGTSGSSRPGVTSVEAAKTGAPIEAVASIIAVKKRATISTPLSPTEGA